MKLINNQNTFESNSEVESMDFTIGDPAVLIDIVRNRIYEHKIRTLVQEYICNGRDACREAGHNVPLQITIPNHFNPVFKVRDYGIGISPDRIANVFVKYGASTKRDSNSQTGGFGIGAKSAWSYTDSFIVTTYLDGVKRTYHAHIGVNNNGRLDLIDTEDTVEQNGTEIAVAVDAHDIREFEQAIYRATFFWTERPTFLGVSSDVIAKMPSFKYEDKLTDRLYSASTFPDYITSRYSDGELVVVVDGIPYIHEPFSKSADWKRLKELTKHTMVIFLNNGEVEVSASREKLSNSEYTTTQMAKLGKENLTIVEQIIKDKFAVNSVYEFFTAHQELSNRFNLKSYSNYEGFTIDQNGNVHNEHLMKAFVFYHVSQYEYQRYSHRNKESDKIDYKRISSIPVRYFKDMFIQKDEMSSREKNSRVRKYLFEDEINDAMILAVPSIKAEPEKLRWGGFKKITTESLMDVPAGEFFIESLKFTKFETLPLASKVIKDPTVKTALQRSKEEITLNKFEGRTWEGYRKERYTVNLNTIVGPYYYIELEDRSMPPKWENRISDLCHISTYLNHKHGIKLVAIGKAHLKTVLAAGLDFQKFDTWFDNYKPDTSELALIMNNSSTFERLLPMSDKLADTNLKDFLLKCDNLDKIKYAYTMPTLLTDVIAKDNSVIEFHQWSERIKEEYSSLEKMLDCLELEELVEFLNFKFNQKGQKNEQTEAAV